MNFNNWISRLALIACIGTPFSLISQEKIVLNNSLSWYSMHGSGLENYEITDKLRLDEQQYAQLVHLVSLKKNTSFIVELSNVKTEPYTHHEKLGTVHSDFSVSSGIQTDRGKTSAWIHVNPFRKQSDRYERLLSYDLVITTSKQIQSKPRDPFFTTKSQFESGQFYKIAVNQSAVYKMDKTFFEQQLGVNLSNINPKHIKVFGNGGGMLPESNEADRIDDIKELPIFVFGESDGKFDANDFVLFYAQGPDVDRYQNGNFKQIKNIYTTKSYYFIKIDNTEGKRIQLDNTNSNTQAVSEFLDVKYYHNDLVNLLDKDQSNQGSGKQWLGEEISNSREFDFRNHFIFEDILTTKKATFNLQMAVRSQNTTSVNAVIDDRSYSQFFGSVNYCVECTFARTNAITGEFNPSGELISAVVKYPQTGFPSEAWVDHLTIQAWRKPIWNNKNLVLRNPELTNQTAYHYLIDNIQSDVRAWNVSDIYNATEHPIQISNNTGTFHFTNGQALENFIVFNPNTTSLTPEFVKAVKNQNLHGIESAELVIIYNALFEEDATRLAEHRKKFSNLNVVTVDIEQIFNEFSSGALDPTGIRDFMRMIYTRDNKLKYLLLFGDASYDFRHIRKDQAAENLVCTYETETYLEPLSAFPSDDYFGLLDPEEGVGLIGSVDVAVGRLLATNKTEASTIVDKIIRYDTEPKTLNDWRLKTVYFADDEDGNVHYSQAETLAKHQVDVFKNYNIDKVYIDAYKQVTLPGGDRYPDANKAINETIDQGALALFYIGHGGRTGLTQERVLQDYDIKSWKNPFSMPLLITATCTFTGFDDPNITAAGELSLLNNNGGAIGLYSTVRAVYSDYNFELTRDVYNHMFVKENGLYLTIGEILRRAKNLNATGGIRENSRKFLLFGDPSQYLAIPEYNVVTTSINGKDPLISIDTVRALGSLSIAGFIANDNKDIVSDFNGEIQISLFDKPISLTTIGNDRASSPSNFDIQKSVLFKGLAKVVNGAFEVSFQLPKDINFQYGVGKISYYAQNGKTDAAGFSDKIIIGGTSGDSLIDDKAPVVTLYMNNTNFKNGGITNQDPILIAVVSDDHGINISGNSIGHDMIAELDNNQQNTILLNSWFKTNLNDFKQGKAEYLLKNLEPGPHHIKVTAWDISNNYGVGELDFIVVEDGNIIIEDLFNAPNPVAGNTEFHFEHNITGSPMDVTVEIYSIAGQLIKTIQQQIGNPGSHVRGIFWDGDSDNNTPVAKGVYVFRVKVKIVQTGGSIEKESAFEKLVIVK